MPKVGWMIVDNNGTNINVFLTVVARDSRVGAAIGVGSLFESSDVCVRVSKLL